MSSSVSIEDDTAPQPTSGRTHPAQRLADSTIIIVAETAADTCVVRITGELDITSTDRVTRACTQGRVRHMVIDLAAVTFLDCGGYRAFVAARTALASQHRVETIVGSTNELAVRVRTPAPHIIRPARLTVHLDPLDPNEDCWRCDIADPPTEPTETHKDIREP